MYWNGVFLKRREVFVAVVLKTRGDDKYGKAAHGTQRRRRYRDGGGGDPAAHEGRCERLVSTLSRS